MGDEYPLLALLEVRERERDDAKAELAEALGNVERAESVVAELRERIDRKERETRAAVARERDRLEETFDLRMVARSGDFERAMSAEAHRLSLLLTEATTKLQEARSVEAGARDDLAEAERELQAVQKHYDGWRRDRATKAKRREAAAMDDIAIARWDKDRE